MTDAQSSVLLIADPGAPVAIAKRLSGSLPSALATVGGEWKVSVRRDAFPVDEHAEVMEVVHTVDPASEAEDIVIYLTDLPRRRETTPFGCRHQPGRPLRNNFGPRCWRCGHRSQDQELGADRRCRGDATARNAQQVDQAADADTGR